MIYKNVLELLESTEQIYPEKVAFGDEISDITFSELILGAKAVGSYLINKIDPCTPVVFCLEKSTKAITGMLGAVYARGFYSLLDVRHPITRMKNILTVLDASIIITDIKHYELAKSINFNGEIIKIEDILEFPINKKMLKKLRNESQDIDPLYVNFTSGSTGTPKGVTVSHRSVIEFIQHFVNIFDIKSNDIIGNQAPFDFDVSVKDIYSGLATGAKVQLIPRNYFSNPMQLMDYLIDKNVTVLIWAVSAMCFISIMNGFGYKVPTSITKVMFSGEIMPIKQLKIWQKYLPNAMYVNLYGPTEITCNCTYYILDREYEDTEVLPAGIPFPNEKVFLLDKNDELVKKINEPGEICVSGTALALGYYNNLEKTNQVFTQNPLNKKYNELIYRTGDIGRYDEDGNLHYISRKDFQIKHLGHRIELGEIEVASMSRDGIDRACCLYDEVRKKIVMFYTGNKEKSKLLEELKGILPPFMLPNVMIQIQSMPLNKNGKIDRNILKEMGGKKR